MISKKIFIFILVLTSFKSKLISDLGKICPSKQVMNGYITQNQQSKNQANLLINLKNDINLVDELFDYISKGSKTVGRGSFGAVYVNEFSNESNPQAVKVIEGPGDPRDIEDPLTLNIAFPGGHLEYVDFFCQTAETRTGRLGD